MKVEMEKSLRKVYSKSESGLSLVELAFVIIIFGILVAPLLHLYKVYQQKERMDKTAMAFTEIEAKLGEFFRANGRYPCPSDRSIGFGQPGHGEENCDVRDMAVDTCTGTDALCRLTGHPPTGTNPQGHILRGGIPYVNLRMPMASTMDGYRNPITYSITQDFADDWSSDSTTARSGAIRVEEVSLDGALPTVTPRDNYIYVLVSSGADANGTYSIEGVRRPCGNAAIGGENCDMDFVYRDSPLSEGANNQDFDDKIAGLQTSASSIWVYADTGGAIYNTNTGAVGVGTKTPNADVKLDVAGDMKATEMRSERFCDASGQNCFETNAIAGNINNCPNGEFVVGIAQNRVQCAAVSLNVPRGQRCDEDDEYVVGFDRNGMIICDEMP